MPRNTKEYDRIYYKENRSRILFLKKKLNDMGRYKNIRDRAYKKAKEEGRIKIWYNTFIKKHGIDYFAKRKSPFYREVTLETNHKFKRDNKCILCNDTERLQFHHWIYKLPVERKHFSTLCRSCHQMIHGRVFNE
jgi:hypothetical protein